MTRTENFVHSWVACSRRSDRGDSAKRCEQKKKGGWGRGEKVPLPLFLLNFSRSLPLSRTPLSEQEQANSWGPLGTRTIDQNHGSFKYQAVSIYTRKK